MKKITVILIGGHQGASSQFSVPKVMFPLLFIAGVLVSSCLGYFVQDYLSLKSTISDYQNLITENRHLRGEADILMENLTEVSDKLERVHSYTRKLDRLTNLEFKKASMQSGVANRSEIGVEPDDAHVVEASSQLYLPSGLREEGLLFRPVFHQLATIGWRAENYAANMKKLLSTLTQQTSLLKSIPSTAPVNGWVASGFGYRISPFTGRRAMHKGLDIAAPVGTPIYAPADGVVIYSGKKGSYGNFLMVAHGYGVVSRYGHNHDNLVEIGQRIKRGEQIATVGQTGRSTGPHLHYEIVIDGKTQNPKKFILNDGIHNIF